MTGAGARLDSPATGKLFRPPDSPLCAQRIAELFAEAAAKL
jgi:hypothetical protein